MGIDVDALLGLADRLDGRYAAAEKEQAEEAGYHSGIMDGIGCTPALIREALGGDGEAAGCGLPDAVNRPAHYTQGGIECIDAIRASLGSSFGDYCKGSVEKYLWRYEHKNGLENLLKARRYLGWLIESVEERP